MVERRVLAYHLILTCYGFWLPNDPRGSNSNHVWADALKPFGPAAKTNPRRSVAHVPHDRAMRLAAKQSLYFAPIRFDGIQARAVAKGFAEALHREHVECYACCVLPDHAHLVLSRPRTKVELFAVKLKTKSVHALLAAGVHPY